MKPRPRDVPPPLTSSGGQPNPSYDPGVAAAIGVKPAIVLQAIWDAAHSPAARTRAHDGRAFVFLPAWAVAQRLGMPTATARRILAELVAGGLLVQARVRGDGRSGHGWYAVDPGAARARCPGAIFEAPPPDAPPRRRRPARRDCEGGGLFAHLPVAGEGRE